MAALAALVLVGAAVSTFRAIFPSVNSDTIYPLVFARDLAAGGDVHSWMITPAPSYPDLALVALLSRFTDSFVAVHESYFGIVVVAIVGVSYAGHRAFHHSTLSAVTYALAGTAAILAAETGFSAARGSMMFPTVHHTPLLLAASAFAVHLSVAAGKIRHRGSVASAIAIGVLGCGDTLFFADVIAPAAALAFFTSGRGATGIRLRAHLVRFTVLATSACLAAGVVARAYGPGVPDREYLVGAGRLVHGAHNYRAFLTDALPREVNPAGVAYLAIWILVALASTIRVRVRGPSLAPDSARLAFASVVLPSMVAVVLGSWADGPVPRYILPSIVLPFLWSGIVVDHAASRRRRVVSLVLAAGLAATILSNGLPWPGRIKEVDDRWPPSGELPAYLASLSKSGIHVGFADYWDAKRLALGAGRDWRINAINEYVPEVSFWLANTDWIFDRDADGHLSYPSRYVVIDRGLRPEVLAVLFGVPSTIREFTRARVLEFTFDPVRYGNIVRTSCELLADAGKACSAVRGLVDLAPLARPSAAGDVDFPTLPLLPGDYEISAVADGPFQLSINTPSHALTPVRALGTLSSRFEIDERTRAELKIAPTAAGESFALRSIRLRRR